MAPSAPFAAAKRTLAMVVSVLLPVQPKKTGMRGVFIFAVSTMISFFSSGASIEVSPVEPMINTADVPCSSWNFSKLRNAPKSTEPSLLKGVISATNEPVNTFFDIAISMPQIAAVHSVDRFRMAGLPSDAEPVRSPYMVPSRGRLQRFRRRGWPARGTAPRSRKRMSSARGDQRRWRERTHCRRRLLPALDLDERGEGARALAQGRRAHVEGQHVGIAMPLRLACRVRRIEPGAGRHHRHSRHHIGIEERTGEASAAGVEQPHDIAVANASPHRVLRVDAHRLAPGNLASARHRSRIHLRVQAAGGLMRDQVERKTLCGGASEPLRRRDPGGMRRAVRITEAGDRLGHDFDSPGGSLERMALRIAPEIFEQDIVALGRRQLDEALGPELLKPRKRHALGGGARAHPVIDPLTPAHLVAVFGEGALIAQALRQRAENVEI